MDLKEELYEIDIDNDAVDDFKPQIDGITKEGYLMKGPEIGKCFFVLHIVHILMKILF